MSRRCRVCGGPLAPDAEPRHRLCRGCVEERRRRLVDVPAIVERVADKFCFAHAEDGERFFIAPAAATALGGLRCGDAVVLTIDPEEAPEPGHRRRALKCARAQPVEATPAPGARR